MKNCFAVLIVTLAFSFTVSGQTESSLLYNSKGQLKLDTSLSISLEQLTRWSSVEQDFIFYLVKNVKYSPIAKENEIAGTTIVEFELDSAGLVASYSCNHSLGGGLEIRILESIRLYKSLATLKVPGKNSGKYYVPFSFNMIKAREFIEKENAIPVFDVNFYFIQY